MTCSVPCLSTVTCLISPALEYLSHDQTSSIIQLPGREESQPWKVLPAGHWSVFLFTLASGDNDSRSILLTHLLVRLSESRWVVQRGKVTCQRTWYQTIVVIPYKQPAPNQKTIVYAIRGPPCQEQISVLTSTWKKAHIKITLRLIPLEKLSSKYSHS